MKLTPLLLLTLSMAALSAPLNAQRIKGSDTVLPLTQEAGEAFLKIHPRASLTVTGGGSGVGLSALVEGVRFRFRGGHVPGPALF